MGKRRYDSWSDEETEYLKDNLGKIPRSKISLELGRSVPAVNQKVRILGLESKKNPNVVSHVNMKREEFYKSFRKKVKGETNDRSTLRTAARHKIRSRINRHQNEDSGRVA